MSKEYSILDQFEGETAGGAMIGKENYIYTMPNQEMRTEKVQILGQNKFPLIKSFRRVNSFEEMITEAVLASLIINKLLPIIEGKAKLLIEASTQIEYIKDELEQMRASLRDADATDDNDEGEKIWVKQVRGVAHKIEDALDEHMFRTSHPNGEGFCSPLQSSIRNLIARNRIASSLEDIRAKIVNISEVHKKYASNRPVQGSSSTGESDRTYDPRQDAHVQEVEPVGIETPRKQLIEWLESSDLERRVVPVVGMGGLGKTTLVKAVYNEPKIKNSFTNHIWINVSEPFNMKNALKHVIEQLFTQVKPSIPKGYDAMNSSTLTGKINKLLLQSKYLLVLDNIWSADTWEAIMAVFPNNNKGSRVMITTRNTDIASTSALESGRYELTLKRLSDVDSWALFSKKTFQNNCPSDLEEICRSILAKCEGLPLAIVAISGVLATKKPTIEEWNAVNGSLNAVMKENSKLSRVVTILSLSYNDLPYYLKYCFLYLSVFPERNEIEYSRLIRLWVAEGFVEAREGRTVEEEAKNYLDQLLARNLIQVAGKTSDGRVKTYHIHNFFREIIMTKAKDQNIVQIATKITVHCPKHVPRRLSLQNTLLSKQHKKLRQMRSLFMFFGELDQLSKLSMPILFSGGLRLLTVLELKDAPLDKFPDAVVKLYLLRYLSLRNTKVAEIPDSIQNLQNLETLDLKHTCVSRLPDQILKLKRIRHILVYRYEIQSYSTFGSKYGFKVPLDIGNLQFLQKLCFIEADQPTSGAMLSKLQDLQQLRRLGILKLKEEDKMALCSTIDKLSNLRALSLMSITDTEILDLKYISTPSKFLQRLYLVGPLESLPQWIPSLHSLVKVFLKWSGLRNDPLRSLEDLPNLVHLELIQACQEDTLCFTTNKFQKLKLLNIDNFNALERIIVEKGAMPNLKKLTIQRCQLLKKVPSGIEGLTKLKVLEFFGMPPELILTIRPNVGTDHEKVAHIPEIYSYTWEDDRWTTSTLRGPDEATPARQPNTEHFPK